MSHWSLLNHPIAGSGPYGGADTTRYTLSSRHADEGAYVVIAEQQMTDLPRRDAWSREADRLWVAAARAGQPLDDDAINLMDVFDLRALRVALERAGRRPEKSGGLLRRLPIFGSALIRRVVGAR